MGIVKPQFSMPENLAQEMYTVFDRLGLKPTGKGEKSRNAVFHLAMSYLVEHHPALNGSDGQAPVKWDYQPLLGGNKGGKIAQEQYKAQAKKEAKEAGIEPKKERTRKRRASTSKRGTDRTKRAVNTAENVPHDQ